MRKRQPSLRLGLPILIAGILAIAVSWSYLGPRVPNGTPPPCFPQSCPELGYYAILIILGFFASLWGAVETGLGFLVSRGYLQLQQGKIPPPIIGSSTEDLQLLSYAKELHTKYKFPKWGIVENLGWAANQPWNAVGFKRGGLRKRMTLLLPADLRERLGTDDWRVLLNYQFLGMKPRLRLFYEFFGFIIVIGTLLTAGFLTASFYGIGASRFYGQYVFSPILLLTIVMLLPMGRRVALRSDRLIADTIGDETLLSVFRKIDSLHLPSVENAKRRRGLIAWLWPMPNITQRIENLSIAS